MNRLRLPSHTEGCRAGRGRVRAVACVEAAAWAAAEVTGVGSSLAPLP